MTTRRELYLLNLSGDMTKKASLCILVAIVTEVLLRYCRDICAQYMVTQVWPQNHVLNLCAEVLGAKDAQVYLISCQHLTCELAHSMCLVSSLMGSLGLTAEYFVNSHLCCQWVQARRDALSSRHLSALVQTVHFYYKQIYSFLIETLWREERREGGD